MFVACSLLVDLDPHNSGRSEICSLKTPCFFPVTSSVSRCYPVSPVSQHLVSVLWFPSDSIAEHCRSPSILGNPFASESSALDPFQSDSFLRISRWSITIIVRVGSKRRYPNLCSRGLCFVLPVPLKKKKDVCLTVEAEGVSDGPNRRC